MSTLYDHLGEDREDELSPADSLIELFSSIETLDAATVDSVAPKMVLLLGQTAAADEVSKLVRLETGFLPHAIGFSSFVDLRPDFTDDRAEIRQFVTVIQFRITTQNANGEEATHTFQLTSEALHQLGEAVEDTQAKLLLARNVGADLKQET
jgi:hypothetical protein